ncbi:MAG: acetate--CoA ligase family protein [Planctomycetota bacterium]|jgi:acetyltransferase
MRSNLNQVFKPRSIAVIGASTRKGSIGWYMVHNIVSSDFNGKLFPVNIKAETIHSIKCYGRVIDIPDPVDLAVICVPKEQALDVADECGRKGVRALVVITAGFKETRGEGVEREAQLLEIVRKYDMIMVGPNCMGVINTDPEVRLNATFAPELPIEGCIGFMSQSGALGVAILNLSRQLGLGLSTFISLGNKADIAANEVIEYLEQDPSTRIIALYLESVGDPRKFKELARRVTRTKPIVLVKAGRTEAGARAASSHTGALAGLDQAVTALTEQAGVLRATSIEDLFDMLQALMRCPLPRGPNVAILTNAGGPAIMATDAISNMGLEMAELSEATCACLATFLPQEASLRNPVDMIASAGAEEYGKALDCIGADEGVDAIMTIFVPPLMIDPHDIISVIHERSRELDKPVVSVVLASLEWHSTLRERLPTGPPVYLFPEAAVNALDALYTYARRRDRESGDILSVAADTKAVDALLDSALADDQGYLPPDNALKALEHYGVPFARWSFPADEHQAVDAARRIGFPVVAKLGGKGIVHKSEVKAVRLGLENEEALVEAMKQMRKDLKNLDPQAEITGFLIQEMVAGEREVFMGMRHDSNYGDLMVFGMGGKYVEVLKDTFMRLAPITDRDAESSRIDILESTLRQISAFIANHPQVIEMDLNPFMAGSTEDTCKAVDVRMRVRRE